MNDSYSDKRYQVFVSSTFKDLKDERNKVIKALLDIDAFPAAMEHFPAMDKDPATYIKSLMSSCDYYILIVGGKYGALTERGISYTRLEYELALELNIPVMSFIHSDVNSLPAEHVEREPEKIKKLQDFLSLVGTRLCKEWENSDQLAGLVVISLNRLVKEESRTGWIRADTITQEHAKLLRENNKEKEKKLALQKSLNKLQKISPISIYKDFDDAWPKIHEILTEEVHAQGQVGEKLKIRCMGLCLHKSSPKLWEFLLSPSISNVRIELRLSILSSKCQSWDKLNNRWDALLEIFRIDVNKFIKKVRSRKHPNISIKLYEYEHMPNVHGILINKTDLFLSNCMWDSENTLTAGQNTYEYYQSKVGEHHINQIKLYMRWFDYGRFNGKTKKDEDLLYDSNKL